MDGLCAACGGTVSREPNDEGAGAAGAGFAQAGAPVARGGQKPTGAAGGSKGGQLGVGGRPPVGTSGASPGGAGGALSVGGRCPGNQIFNGECACPPYAPTYCAAANKCVNLSKDPEHCGDCDTQCGATNACAAGECTADLKTFASFPGCGSLLLQATPSTLYALATKAGKLFSITLPGGGTPSAVASGMASGSAFALDATNAYVATGLTVTQVNLGTGVKTVLVTETSAVFDVAVAQGKIYYATGKGIKQADATTPGVGTFVALSADEGEAQGVAISSGVVLYVSNLAFNVEAAPISGDGRLKLGASQGSLVFGHRSIQADATSAYWANSALQSIPFVGEQPSSSVAQPIDGSPVVAFAVDSPARTAYIATEDGSFESSSFDDAMAGNEATWLARGLEKATSVVLDDAHAYLASGCTVLASPR